MPSKTVFISIAGKPNVGKSTLLNSLIGDKVAIVSKKPQTTRNRITGILTLEEKQYVFTDTPGLHKPHTKLGEYMMKAAGCAVDDADVVLFVIESGSELNLAEKQALDKLAASKANVILIINKCDVADKGKVAMTIQNVSSLYSFKSVIPVSALTGDGVEIILEELEPFLVEAPHMFPDDVFTDQPEKQIFAEIIREKILRLLDEEVPHGVAVVIEKLEDKKNVIVVNAAIICEKEAHKKIIIGKNGAMIKKIGTYAREDSEKLFDAKVYIETWVKVKENWRDRQSLVSNFGYKDE